MLRGFFLGGTDPHAWVLTRDTGSNASVWPIKLGLPTPTDWCDPLDWGYVLPQFGLAP